MKISKVILSLFLLSVLIISCNDDDDIIEPKGDYENGIIVSGEGGASGSVYYVSNDYATTESLIYKKVNEADLGTYLQSIAFDDSRAFIIVDNQNTITVVDRYTFQKVGEITLGLALPRFMVVKGDTGYATNWGSTSDDSDDFVAVIDLNTNEVTSTISVANGPERIVEKNGKLYVSHKGAYTTNNIVTVIDIATKATIEIIVKDNPDELFFDSSDRLIVLSQGRTIYDASWNVIGQTSASISKINTSTNTVVAELVFPNGQNPSLMIQDNSTIYYNLGSKVYKMDDSAMVLPTTEFLDTAAGYFYGMAVKNDNLYVIDVSFSAESSMDIYSVSTKAKTTSVSAPVGASKIYFN